MKRALLDVNVLLALFDSEHISHQRARAWLERERDSGWASCAITQNGFVRIITQPKYPSSLTVAQAMGLLANATGTDHHEFWPCSVSLLDETAIDRRRLHGHRQITDAYLLALATAHGGRFVTFDNAIVLETVPAANKHDLVVL